MADVVKISTSKYVKEGMVEVDGHIWKAKLPGAGSQLRLSQAIRENKLYGARLESINKKIDDGTSNDEDLDKMEEYNAKYLASEKTVYATFALMLKDDTEDNSEVKQWLEYTPLWVIQLAFEDIKNQANGTDDTTQTQNI